MNISHFEDAVKNCRFCFMCRHLSGTANVTCREADTPRVRAAMLDAVLRGAASVNNADLVDVMYADDLSAACTFHCVSHYPENALVLAARRDIVDAGAAPAKVKQLADDLEKTAQWSVSGPKDAKVVFFEDIYTARTPAIATAFAKLAKAAKVSYRTVSGGCFGKALSVLGFADRSKKLQKKFAAFLNKLGADTLVVSNPAAYDALVNDFAANSIALKLKVVHTSEFLAGLKISFKKKAGALYYLDSDFLKNYNNALPFPGQLLDKLGAKGLPFGTNNEESYSAGEGAVVLPLLNPALTSLLAKRVESRADNPKKDKIVTSSPYTRLILSEQTALNVVTLEELAAACL